MPMTEKQIEAVLDRAGIGHARGSTLRKGAWWVTAGSVDIVPVAHAFERATREQAEPVARDIMRWMEGMGEKVFFLGGMPAVEEMNALHARLAAWLNKEDSHAPQA